MIEKLILIGGGGHAKACIEVINSSGRYQVEGIIDSAFAKGDIIEGCRVLGSNAEMLQFTGKDYRFLVAVGQVNSPATRMRIYEELSGSGAELASVIASTALVSSTATVGKGTIVMHYAMVNAAAKVGNNVILNNKCLVEHDSVVGDHCHISTGAIVNGGCVVGDRVFVGSAAVLVQGISIVPDVVIGAGSVVNRSIQEAGTYAGNPAKKISG